MEQGLSGGVMSASGAPGKADIIAYIRVRLSKNWISDTMGWRLAAEILREIHERLSEM